jgi:hypothetical protein
MCLLRGIYTTAGRHDGFIGLMGHVVFGLVVGSLWFNRGRLRRLNSSLDTSRNDMASGHVIPAALLSPPENRIKSYRNNLD